MAGFLSANVVQQFTANVSFTGAGFFAATAVGYTTPPASTLIDKFAFQDTTKWNWPAPVALASPQFSGVGALSGVVSPLVPVAPAFAGVGALSATATIAVPPISYDALGSGCYLNDVTSGSFTHTAKAGADIWLMTGGYAYTTDQPTTVTYGGTAMTKICDTTSVMQYGPAALWYLKGGGTGSQVTVNVSNTSAGFYVANCISVLGSKSYGTPNLVKADSSLSQGPISATTQQMILQCFGVEFDQGASSNPTVTGGVNVYSQMGTPIGSGYGGLTINYSTLGTTTFVISSLGSRSGTGIAVVLS
jgi:hypothetical protein